MKKENKIEAEPKTWTSSEVNHAMDVARQETIKECEAMMVKEQKRAKEDGECFDVHDCLTDIEALKDTQPH